MKEDGPAVYGSGVEDNPLINLTLLLGDEDEDDAGERFCDRFEFWLCVVIMVTLCLLGVLGNVTSLVVLGRHKAEPTSIFILQVLSVSDTVLLVTSLLVYVPNLVVVGRSSLLKTVQIYTWPLSMMAHTVTVWVTVLLTLNRYHAVVTLVRNANSLARMRVKVIILVVCSILYNVPRFFEHHVVRRELEEPENGTENASYRKINLGDIPTYQIVYSIILYYPVMYIVPFISLAYLNTKLMAALKDIKKKRQAITGHKIKEDHVTVIVIVIVITFICCQTPALVNQIFWATLSHSERRCGSFHFYYTRISDILVVLNSSANFAIYCLFGKTFRQVFLYTICPRSRENPNEVTITRPKNLSLNKATYV